MNFAINDQFDHQTKTQDQDSRKLIPEWIIWTQCICFAILYAIWNYPHTNFLSDVCMIIGALLSIYILYYNRSFFKTKQAIPFWLLLVLLLWIVFHLLFLSNNFTLQFRELTTIWKRVVIAIIFALGFSIALVNSPPRKGYWIIFYLGMTMPLLIYLFKYYLVPIANYWDSAIPDALELHEYRNTTFFMYKTDFSTFILPTVAISLGAIFWNYKKKLLLKITNLIYILIIALSLHQFTLANIKNAIAYATILIIFFIYIIIKDMSCQLKIYKNSVKNYKVILATLMLVIIFGFVTSFFLDKHIENSPSWKSLLHDSLVAINVGEIDNWKYWGAQGYPKNALGNIVSATNYDRVAWGIIGFQLLQDNPLGFGLVENSFGHLTKIRWSDSMLLQSHSGWLDLALGIGVPGVFLVLSVIGLILYRIYYQLKNNKNEVEVNWILYMCWVITAIILLWCTSEISLKTYIVNLFFWISFSLGVSTKINNKN